MGLDQLDPAVWAAVQYGAQHWPGTVEVTSVGRHKGDKGNHSGGHAVDVKLYDEGGKPLSNIRDGGRHARDYEKFWQNGVALASEEFPDLPTRARWGGNFLNSVGADYMHLDVTPGRSTAGGDLLHGANAAMLRKWGGQSEGVGDWATYRQTLKGGPAAEPGLLARAGQAALDFVMPAAQAEESNPFMAPEFAKDAGAEESNPFMAPEFAKDANTEESNPFMTPEFAKEPGDAGPSTVIQGTGLPPEALQATVPTGPVNPAPLAQPPYQPQALPPTPTQQMRSVLEGIGPLGAPMAATLPPDVIEQDQALEAVGSERLPEKVIGDFRGGAPGISPNEFEGVRSALERGALQQPKSIRDLFVGAVPPGALNTLDDAIARAMAKRELANTQNPILDQVPGGRVGLELLGRAVDEATLGAARPGLPVSGSRELQRLLKSVNAAEGATRQDIQERFPMSSGVATLAGGVVPYALGLKGLRGVRSAAGLSPVGPGTLGQVAEGAQLGGPIEFLRKPEGEPTSPGEELQQRALQAGLGVALGAALDAGMGATGSAYDVARAGLGARKQRLGVEKEARDAGFADSKSYLDSLFKRVETPDGVIAVPSRDVFDGSPRQSAPALPPPSSPQAAASGAVDSSPKPFVPGMLPAPEAKPTAAAPVEPTPRPATRGPADLVAEAERLEQTAAVISDPVAKQVLLTEAALRRQEADAVARGEQPKRTREEVQKARAKERVTVDPEKDDLVTAIRKLGGIDVDLESDWAGRLSHLNKKLIGVPGIERTGGKGRSLDDLAEALQERGYLHSRDVKELEARLWQAEKGEPQWSYAKADYQAPERPPEAGTGGAPVRVSRERVAFEDVPEDTDWIIDTETGSVYASAPISEEEFIDIEIDRKRDETRQQREAEWAKRELEGGDEQSIRSRTERSPLPNDEGNGISKRMESEIPKRQSDQSKDGEIVRYFKTLEERDNAVDNLINLAKENGRPTTLIRDAIEYGANPEKVKELIEGSLRNDDFYDALDELAGEAIRKNGGLRQGFGQEKPVWNDYPIKADDKPSMSMSVRDRYSFLESLNSDEVDWLRKRLKAKKDTGLTSLVDRLDDMGRDGDAIFDELVSRRSSNVSEKDQTGDFFGGLSDAEQQTADKLALEELNKEKQRKRNANNAPPADEGLFGLDNRQDEMDLSEKTKAASKAEEAIRDAAINVEGRIIGSWYPITVEHSNRVQNFLSNIKRVYSDGNTKPSISLAQVKLGRLLDGEPLKPIFYGYRLTRDNELLAEGLPRFASEAEVKRWEKSFGKLDASSDLGTLYSNPLGAVAKNFAADVKEAPGRAVLELLTGGALAGTWASKEEPGSMAWWRDVLVGGALLKGGLGTLRKTGLTGKGQYFEKQVFGKLGTWWDGLPLVGQGPIGVRDLKREQQAVLARLNRQTENVGRFLLQQFKPSERAMMSDLIEGRGIVPEFNRVHRQAKALDEFLTDMGQKLKDLGMLPEDLELGGYLHRYYEKHLGVSKLFREAKRQSLSGTYSLARGTDGEFQREYLSPGARAVVEEFDAVQAEIASIEKDIKRWDKDLKKAQKSDDPDLFMEKYAEAMEGLTERLEEAKDRLKELRKTEFTEFVGEENGKAKSFIFKAGEVGRVESDVGPVKAHQFRPKAIEKAVGPAMPVKEIPELYPSARKWNLRGTKEGAVTLHRDWTEAERKAWGEIRDAGYRYVRGMSEATNDLSLAMMFQKIARNGNWVSDTPVDGWVKVGKDTVGKGSPMRKYGALAGKWVKPDVWNGITRYGRSVLGNSLPARVYREALNTWKLWHTADNPVTHFNNLFSNSQMLMLAGYGPKDLAEALSHMRQGEKSKLWSEAADEGLFGNDFTAATLSEGGMSGNLQELSEALRTQAEIPDAALVTSTLMKVKQWWHDSGQHLREAKGTRDKAGALASMLGKPAAVAGKTVAKPYQVYARAMRKAYRFEDNLFKMAVYAAERKAGASSIKAAEAAERYFFDYYDLPDAVRFARDLPIGSPFISYTYLASKALIHTAIERPERILALVATFEAINAAAMRMNEEGGQPGGRWALDEAESVLSAPWDRGRSAIGLRNTVHLPSADGYRVALGNAHVMGGIFQGESGGREKLPEMPLLGKLWGSSIFGGSPAHALLDIAVNEDWKGKPIYGDYDQPEDKTAKALAYLYRAWMPGTPVFPGSYHQTKILEGMANDAAEARAQGGNSLAEPVVQAANAVAEGLGFQQLTGKDRMRNPIDTTEAMLGSVGIKLRPPGYDQTLDIELSRLQKERNEIRSEFRAKGRDFAEKRYTKDQFKRYQDDFWDRMKEVDTREAKLFEARKTLKAAGFPLKRSKKRTLQ